MNIVKFMVKAMGAGYQDEKKLRIIHEQLRQFRQKEERESYNERQLRTDPVPRCNALEQSRSQSERRRM